ncbi:MAG: hypothetical protein IJW16_03905 [Clostridia bacterium]|nr:hypothetical protein [Clostridia bacterium]
MKRIAAFFAFIMMSISAFCLSVSAAEDKKEVVEEEAPMLQEFFAANGQIILFAALGAFALIAIIMLIVTHTRSRKKYMKKREKKKEEAKIRAMIEAKLAGKDIDADENAGDPYAYDPYYAYYYGMPPQQPQQPQKEAEPSWNHPTYKTLENSAVEVPARDVKAVPEIKEGPAKQVKAVAMVQPVVVKDLVTVPRDCPKCKTVKLEDAKKDNSTAKKVVATVALTALGCHLLGKLKK